MSAASKVGRFGEPLSIESGFKGPYIIGVVPHGRPNGEGLVEFLVQGIGLEKLGMRAAVFAQRIVACVNALAGIPSPETLPSLIAALLADREAWARYDALDKATATQDEILEACAKTAETRRMIDTALSAVMGETT